MYGGAAHGGLSFTERQRVHSNIIGIYRVAAGEAFDAHEFRLTDLELLKVYGLRAPYTTIRFSRLRMAVRLLTKAPAPLLVLIFAARSDSRSW